MSSDKQMEECSHFLSLWPTDRDMNGNLFVTTDAKRSNGVARLARHRRLTSKLFQDLLPKIA